MKAASRFPFLIFFVGGVILPPTHDAQAIPPSASPSPRPAVSPRPSPSPSAEDARRKTREVVEALEKARDKKFPNSAGDPSAARALTEINFKQGDGEKPFDPSSAKDQLALYQRRGLLATSVGTISEGYVSGNANVMRALAAVSPAPSIPPVPAPLVQGQPGGDPNNENYGRYLTGLTKVGTDAKATSQLATLAQSEERRARLNDRQTRAERQSEEIEGPPSGPGSDHPAGELTGPPSGGTPSAVDYGKKAGEAMMRAAKEANEFLKTGVDALMPLALNDPTNPPSNPPPGGGTPPPGGTSPPGGGGKNPPPGGGGKGGGQGAAPGIGEGEGMPNGKGAGGGGKKGEGKNDGGGKEGEKKGGDKKGGGGGGGGGAGYQSKGGEAKMPEIKNLELKDGLNSLLSSFQQPQDTQFDRELFAPLPESSPVPRDIAKDFAVKPITIPNPFATLPPKDQKTAEKTQALSSPGFRGVESSGKGSAPGAIADGRPAPPDGAGGGAPSGAAPGMSGGKGGEGGGGDPFSGVGREGGGGEGDGARGLNKFETLVALKEGGGGDAGGEEGGNAPGLSAAEAALAQVRPPDIQLRGSVGKAVTVTLPKHILRYLRLPSNLCHSRGRMVGICDRLPGISTPTNFSFDELVAGEMRLGRK